MGKRVVVLYSGPHIKKRLLSLEASKLHKNPDAAIHFLCSLVEGLSPAARRLWDVAQKDFDIGYESRSEVNLARFTLRTDTLQRIANLGASVAVSFYRHDNRQDKC